MALHSPVLIQPASGDPSIVATAQEFRQFTGGLVGALSNVPFSTASFGTLGGVANSGLPSAGADTGDFAVNQHGSGAFSVDISAGLALVIGNDATGQGAYLIWNDAAILGVATPTAPASGTRNHRVILQIQDHLTLPGSWPAGTYQGAVSVVADTVGSGALPTPSPNNSYITLAAVSIAAGQSSVLNANITDYRRSVGPVAACKTSSEGRSGTALNPDTSLQLWGLQGSSRYAVTGNLFYHGDNMGTSTSAGGLSWTFTAPSGSSGTMQATRFDLQEAGGSHYHTSGGFSFAWTDTVSAVTNGTGVPMTAQISGQLNTGSAPPNNYLILNWGMANSGSATATLEAGSWLQAVRVA